MTVLKTIPVAGLALPFFLAAVPMAHAQSGMASWYALRSRTACGERMNPSALTAAHRTLPCGTMIEVTNRRTGRVVTARVNDRGPFIRGRIVDLSRGAAQHIGLTASGTAPVNIRVVER